MRLNLYKPAQKQEKLFTNGQTWIFAGSSTQVSYDIKGLESGSKCWFWVAPVTSAGMGSWSDPVMKVVP
jgi:hypothetical protein